MGQEAKTTVLFTLGPIPSGSTRPHLISACWLKLLGGGGREHSRFLKKHLEILLPVYLPVGKSQPLIIHFLPQPVPWASRKKEDKVRRTEANKWWGVCVAKEPLVGVVHGGEALTWAVACPPWRACSTTISAASSSVRLSDIKGSRKCSDSSLTRAWREPRDTDTSFPQDSVWV